MEKNAELYQRYFWVWIKSIIVCIFAASITGVVLSDINEKFLVPLTVGIAFCPLFVVGVYGLKRGYSIAHWWNNIYRGTGAVLVNILFLMIYVIILFIFL